MVKGRLRAMMQLYTDGSMSAEPEGKTPLVSEPTAEQDTEEPQNYE
jgi:hypothetical protein